MFIYIHSKREQNMPVDFHGPIAPLVPNAPSSKCPSSECPRDSIAARRRAAGQSEYPIERRAAAAVPLPESP